MLNLSANPVSIGLLMAQCFTYVMVYMLGEDSHTTTGKGAVFVTVCVQVVGFLIIYGFLHLLGF